MPDERIQWHPAFATALKLELGDYYPDVLEIQEEYQLTSKPLEVDILVIKKIQDRKILVNIARMFKEHNIVEYKSPDDYLSIDDYYKVKAYAYLYKTLAEKVDGIKVGEMTITLTSSRYPRKMASIIEKEQKVRVEKQSEGIYYIAGADIETQIVVIDELPPKENRYIRLLTIRMNIKEEISMLIKDYADNPKDSKRELLLETVAASNLMQIMEVYNMARVLTREEETAVEKVIMKLNLNKKWYEQGREEGIEEGIKEGVKDGQVLSLLRILNKKIGGLSVEQTEKIKKIEDINTVNKILDNIFEIDTFEILEKYLHSEN